MVISIWNFSLYWNSKPWAIGLYLDCVPQKCMILHLLFFSRKLLPDLARSLVITAIDPVFPTHKVHTRGYNGFHKIWRREEAVLVPISLLCHIWFFLKSMTYCSSSLQIFFNAMVESCCSCKRFKYMLFMYMKSKAISFQILVEKFPNQN